MKSIWKNSGSHLLTSITVTLVLGLFETASSNERITFKDIAENPATGLSYERVPSVYDSVLNEFKQQPLLLDLTIPTLVNIARLPGETRGFPGVAILDYDMVGDLDVYVTNEPGQNNSLFSNQLQESGLLSFVDVGTASGASAQDQHSSGVCFGDTDIVFYGSIDAIFASMATNPGMLIQNGGKANFQFDAATMQKTHTRRNVHGLATGDLNKDGFVDIISVSSFDSPEPIPQLPIGLAYGGPLDSYANFVPNFAPVSPGV